MFLQTRSVLLMSCHPSTSLLLQRVDYSKHARYSFLRTHDPHQAVPAVICILRTHTIISFFHERCCQQQYSRRRRVIVVIFRIFCLFEKHSFAHDGRLCFGRYSLNSDPPGCLHLSMPNTALCVNSWRRPLPGSMQVPCYELSSP